MLRKFLAVVCGHRVDEPAEPPNATQDGVAYVLGGAVRRVCKQVKTAAALGHGDDDRLAGRRPHGVDLPVADAAATFHDGWPLCPMAPVLQLAAPVTQAASSALPAPPSEIAEQQAATALVGVNMAVDPLVARQPGPSSDLLGAVILGQQGLDLPDLVGANPLAPAGSYAPQACCPLCGIRAVAPWRAVTPQLTADRAGRAVQDQGDGPDVVAGLEKGMDAVSFVQVQAA